MTALLAPMPQGDGPKRSHIHLRNALSNIARRVAMKALAEGRRDVLLEVYAAGLAHAALVEGGVHTADTLADQVPEIGA